MDDIYDTEWIRQELGLIEETRVGLILDVLEKMGAVLKNVNSAECEEAEFRVLSDLYKTLVG